MQKKGRGQMARKTIIPFIIMLIFCVAFSGCIYIVAGTVGALGGYAISKDTMEGITERSYSDIWDTSLKVLSIMGSVISEDEKKGIIEAEIDSSSVKVVIEELAPGVIRLTVTARKLLLPNIKLAQKFYVKIIEHSK